MLTIDDELKIHNATQGVEIAKIALRKALIQEISHLQRELDRLDETGSVETYLPTNMVSNIFIQHAEYLQTTVALKTTKSFFK